MSTSLSGPRQTRRQTTQFVLDAETYELVVQHRRPLADVARDLGISYHTAYDRLRRHRQRIGLHAPTPDLDQLRRDSIARLDFLQSMLQAKILDGNPIAIREAGRLERQRKELVGLLQTQGGVNINQQVLVASRAEQQSMTARLVEKVERLRAAHRPQLSESADSE